MATWSLIANYEHEARDPEIDRILEVFLRAHDRRFLPPQTRAALATICIEALLGRFRPRKAEVQLEDLVQHLDGARPSATAWFRANGRKFRNQVAHGQWNPESIGMPDIWSRDHEPLEHLVEICRAGIASLLETWVGCDPPVRARHGPARLLVRSIRKRM